MHGCVENIATKKNSKRVIPYGPNCGDTVSPNDRETREIEPRHIDMRDDRIVVSIATTKDREKTVLQESAGDSKSATVYVATG
ncbi:hypothetical protein D9619_004598 [Psilocybe cf. subviscida]|uniref:Uncharacterized protein n=1 Tax=Psilocybe cf. subviscida TaxID=2480587 RepID=A0A8H5BR83_9AGAR|nr:hypothetical protein D9619_004598 [Psilocybe cf. subviscida]